MDATSSAMGSTATRSRATATWRRSSFGSKTTTSAPTARATLAISRPIGPAPTTTVRSLGASPERRTSCTATAVGSASAAVCSDRSVGQADEYVGRHVPVRLHGPGRIDAEEDQPVADVRGAAPAGSAVTARHEGHDRRRVPDCPTLDAVADRRNAARHLVAEHRRHRHACIHRAVEDVEVGAADPGVGDFELHLPGPGRSPFGVDDLERTVPDVVGGIHMMSIYICIAA